MSDPNLFRSARFTWGTILQAFGVFSLFGLLFALPQYLQAVLGVDAMGSGLRLLPLLAGLVLGAGLASAQSAFVHGIDLMLWVSVGVAVFGIVLSLLFLPWRAAAATTVAAAKEASEREESAYARAD